MVVYLETGRLKRSVELFEDVKLLGIEVRRGSKV
jgi:hypothetical protein